MFDGNDMISYSNFIVSCCVVLCPKSYCFLLCCFMPKRNATPYCHHFPSLFLRTKKNLNENAKENMKYNKSVRSYKSTL